MNKNFCAFILRLPSLLYLNVWMSVVTINATCATYTTHAQDLLLSNHTIEIVEKSSAAPLPIRFLLTFDDGPDNATSDNTTEIILNTLKHHQRQPSIKALFLIQTRSSQHGGSEHGKKIIQKEMDEGHAIGFHTSTPNHTNHTSLNDIELSTALENGIHDIQAITGTRPTLVRPPFWSYNTKSFAQYRKHGLSMLLTDLSANDGVAFPFNRSFRKRSNMLNMLRATQLQWEKNLLPSYNGVTPIIVTFHDTNSHTADNMALYLDILLDVAKELHIPLSEKPFYDNKDELIAAALTRTVSDPQQKTSLPGIWNWIWK